jgi:hypothetical protein
VQPNSLVFVAIVGIWAVFFVQYWVRRRSHAHSRQLSSKK